MKDIHDVFSEVISKHLDFYMAEKEFEEAWEKVTKEMARRYKVRGKGLCSSEEEIRGVRDWFKIGKTRREDELEKRVKELEETLKEYEDKELSLNRRITDLESRLKTKDSLKESSRELKMKLDSVEKKLRKYENREIEACAKENRKFRAYEKYANSIEGISEWGDYVSEIVRCEAEERREWEKAERLF